MKLELLATQAVTWARTVERAVHDPGPWTFRTAGGITPAHRLLDPDRAEIIFTGLIRPCQDGDVELWCRDGLVSVTIADLTKGHRLTWKMSLREPTPAF
jgi:hypothetical protein